MSASGNNGAAKCAPERLHHRKAGAVAQRRSARLAVNKPNQVRAR